jgi:hypothetical protein
MATAPQHADRTASEARRPGSRNPGRRRQRCGRLANASPVRDERIANLEQRDPRSGDAQVSPIYHFGSMRQVEVRRLQQQDEFDHPCRHFSNQQSGHPLLG